MAGQGWIEKEFRRESDGWVRRIGTSKRSKIDPDTLKAEGFKVSAYYVGHREPVTGRKRYRRFDTFEQARAFKTDLDKDVQDGVYVPKTDRQQRFGAYVEGRLDSWHRLAPSTLAGYRGSYENHVKEALAYRTMEAITKDVLQRFMNDLIDRAGNGTVVAVDQFLRKVFNEAHRDGIYPRSPMRDVQTPKRNTEEIIALAPETVEALADAIEPRYRLAVLLSAYGGFRAGEIGGLRLQDIDFETRTVTIKQAVRTVAGVPEISTPKTKAGRRRVKLPASLVEEVRLHLRDFEQSDDGRIFCGAEGGLVSHITLNKAFVKAKARVGITKPSFHGLRHTCAALMIQTGAHPKAIQLRMGHEDIQTTLNTYGHLFPALDEEIADRLDTIRTSAVTAGRAVPQLAEVSEG